MRILISSYGYILFTSSSDYIYNKKKQVIDNNQNCYSLKIRIDTSPQSLYANLKDKSIPVVVRRLRDATGTTV